MKKELEEFFKKEKIEYYRVKAYSDCKEISHGIMARENFTPKSVIIFLIPYFVSDGENLSAYATSLDYHIIIKNLTNKLSELVLSLYPGAKVKGYGDHSPIDERDAALTSGLGILGDNGLLINEKYGTYVFIADLVTDLSPEIFGDVEKTEVKRCIGCGACKKNCPTGILSGEGNSCLSAITQRKGDLSENEISLMRKYNTVWGCDECQRCCPYNVKKGKTPIEFFEKSRIERLTLNELDSMTKEEFKERAFSFRGKAPIKRNLELLDYK
jgi:epoxyqueuosine reductase